MWWSMLSKKPLMSPSINQTAPGHFLISWRAEWHPLFGLNPWEEFENFGSRIISRTSLIACCTILSRGELIPSGLSLPLGFGIKIRLAGFGL